MIDVANTFAKFDDEFLKNDFSGRADLAAFNMLERLVPGSRGMIAGAEHDQIWLDVSIDDLSVAATENDIHELVKLGIRYDDDYGCLAMFV
jgi:hypothetical protein